MLESSANFNPLDFLLKKSYISMRGHSVMNNMKISILLLSFVCTLLAADIMSLPKVTPELKNSASEYYNSECKGCHRWNRKFAAPAMKENVSHYVNAPEMLVKYLMKPEPKHPETWAPMEIAPTDEANAKKMAAFLFYILEHEDDSLRPK